MQMSATTVFVLVEGRWTDTFFYSELTRPACKIAGIEYEIVRGDRFGESGGKQTLIGLYKYLESTGSLRERTKGTFSICIFYLDKDVDDILGVLIESPHVVYTPFYSVENVLFLHGELVRAAAAASSLDAASIGLRIQGSREWCREKAEQWKDFVVLCLFSQKLGANCDCNYGSNKSPINEPPEAPTNLHDAAARKAELEARSGLAQAKFDRKFRASVRLVDRLYRKDQHDLVFNGKWYRELVMREIELAATGQRYKRHGLANGLTAALSASLDFNAPWAEHFRGPLRDLITAEPGVAQQE